MSPSLRHLGIPQQASLKRPLQRLCSSTAAAINNDPKAEYGRRQHLVNGFGGDGGGAALGSRLFRARIVPDLPEALALGTSNRCRTHGFLPPPSPRSDVDFDAGSGLLNNKASPRDMKNTRPLFFSTSLAEAASASGPPPSPASSTARPPPKRVPGVPREASRHEHGAGGDRLDGLQQHQGRRVFSSVPAFSDDVYHHLHDDRDDADAIYNQHSSLAEENGEDLLRKLAREKATVLSLRDIHAFCQSGSSAARVLQAQFLHREIPIRLAQRVLELRNLPHGLSETAPVIEAAGWYTRIMRQLADFPAPDGAEGEERFAGFLSSLLMDNARVPQALSRGVLELRERREVGQVQRHRIDRILDSFFISRISLRFLVDTYISSKANKPGFSGVIQSECSPVMIAWRAAKDVDHLCRVHMGTAPPIEVFGREKETFTAVPSHLYYILREVLKNSCRATVEHCRRTRPGQKLPPVKIIVARGKEDMTIKIMDEGGGIRRSDLQHVWSYMFSTALTPTALQLSQVPLDHMSGMWPKENRASLGASSPEQGANFAFAGYGMGLPLSRLYARYFGGSLKLRPMEGYGTDTYVHLHRIKTNSEELLPNSLEETLRVMDDDGRVYVTSSRSWKTPPKDDNTARTLIRSLGGMS